jgi:uncharacterized protein (DUF433 family)
VTTCLECGSRSCRFCMPLAALEHTKAAAAATALQTLPCSRYANRHGPRQIVHFDPEIVSGTPVFVGTRVPAQALLDYLEGGETIEEFLDNFPSVHREQAIAFLVLNVAAYEDMVEDIELLRDVRTAIKEIEAGKGLTNRKTKAELRWLQPVKVIGSALAVDRAH